MPAAASGRAERHVAQELLARELGGLRQTLLTEGVEQPAQTVTLVGSEHRDRVGDTLRRRRTTMPTAPSVHADRDDARSTARSCRTARSGPPCAVRPARTARSCLSSGASSAGLAAWPVGTLGVEQAPVNPGSDRWVRSPRARPRVCDQRRDASRRCYRSGRRPCEPRAADSSSEIGLTFDDAADLTRFRTGGRFDRPGVRERRKTARAVERYAGWRRTNRTLTRNPADPLLLDAPLRSVAARGTERPRPTAAHVPDRPDRRPPPPAPRPGATDPRRPHRVETRRRRARSRR